MAVKLTGTGTYEVTIERAGGWFSQLASGLDAAEACGPWNFVADPATGEDRGVVHAECRERVAA